jgi:hypothetical protein
MARVKGGAFSAGGLPIVYRVPRDRRDWGLIQQLGRACTAWLLRRGIYDQEGGWQ